MSLELLKRGTFRCVVVEPKASFKGLLVKATTPWGPMSAVLDEESIPPTVQRSFDPDRPSARP